MNDLKSKIEILPCCMCEMWLDCEDCDLLKEAGKLYEQVRTKTIEEFAGRLLCEMGNMGIQRTVMKVMEQMKEKKE